ncbi:Ig-like domain-containing protein [Flavobacterium polysaccharolyticum]|uniref:Ig-like domain-containing protein n=1 Tax=Flavobacterium polysaccharolyticum TaxID=3133148 RepID=A0ABU9NLR7_9FLAO
MSQTNYRSILFLLLFVCIGCAKKGSITGGLKDTIAPTLKISFPENFSTNFKGNQIKLTFDEYVKLKGVEKQLIVSPPMKNEPLIIPSTVTKYLTIQIKDTLQPNTTYSFNFGQSITDNNEGNPLNQFKYVFSTGPYIDSLALGGRVKDALEKEVESFVSVMLYEVNEKFKDSVVYTNPPRYITNTLDSLKTFRLENLKAGKYLLVAMKDRNNNNKFNPRTDKIGFHKQFVTIPNDTVYEIELFKEVLPFKALKPYQASGNRLVVAYDGKQDFSKSKPKIILKNNTQTIESIVTQFPKKDSLQVWYKPIKVDSLLMNIKKEGYVNDFSVKIKNQKKDTLSISAVQTGILNLRDQFTLETSTPLIKIDPAKIKLTDGAAKAVAFTHQYDDFHQKLVFDFKKVPSEKYEFKLLPGALTDFFEKSNDTLTYKLNTRSETDYGNLTVVLNNAKRFPIIIELTNTKGEVLASEFTEKKNKVVFTFLEPANYTLRAIYDDNKNQKYDSGNFLEKRQSEEVIYFSKEVDVRANWEVEQSFDLSIPYTPEPKKKEDKDKKKKK